MERRWEEDSLLSCESACRLNGRGKDRLDSAGVEVGLSPQVIGDEDEFHWPFGRCEFHGRVIRLFVCG